MRCWVYVTVGCPSVRPSVCPSSDICRLPQPVHGQQISIESCRRQSSGRGKRPCYNPSRVDADLFIYLQDQHVRLSDRLLCGAVVSPAGRRERRGTERHHSLSGLRAADERHRPDHRRDHVDTRVPEVRIVYTTAIS